MPRAELPPELWNAPPEMQQAALLPKLPEELPYEERIKRLEDLTFELIHALGRATKRIGQLENLALDHGWDVDRGLGPQGR